MVFGMTSENVEFSIQKYDIFIYVYNNLYNYISLVTKNLPNVRIQIVL